jgi:hypothetical protein
VPNLTTSNPTGEKSFSVKEIYDLAMHKKEEGDREECGRFLAKAWNLALHGVIRGNEYVDAMPHVGFGGSDYHRDFNKIANDFYHAREVARKGMIEESERIGNEAWGNYNAMVSTMPIEDPDVKRFMAVLHKPPEDWV